MTERDSTLDSDISTSKPTTPDESGGGLRGHLGPVKLAMTVLALNAPLAVATGFLTVIVGAGNTIAAPLAILAIGVLLTLFAVGFTTMGSLLPNAGAFYAYITAGLGRPLGLGASFVAIAAYTAATAGGMAFFGIAMNGVVTGIFGGPEISWWIYGVTSWVIVTAFSYFNIEFSAKLLTILLTCEILVVVLFDLIVTVDGGPEGRSLAPFNPVNLSGANVGFALLYAAVIITGFEATAIFREECRDPAKTVPRATYMAVGGMAIGYALTTWAIITAVGTSTAVESAATDPTGTFFAALEKYMGTVTLDIVSVLLVTSVFAANLGAQNVVGRYLFSLGNDGILPNSIGRAHPKHGSPHRAAVIAAVLTLIMSAVFFGVDSTLVYAGLLGFAGFCLLTLYLTTAVGVFVYFRRNPGLASIGRTMVAPAIATFGLASAWVLATMNLDLLVGGSGTIATFVVLGVASLGGAGAALAVALRHRAPEVYRRIGRQEL